MQAELSEKSLQAYSRCLRQLREHFKADSHDFLLDHKAVIDWVESLDKAHNTRKLFYISLVATLKRLNRPEFAGALSAYKAKQDEYNRQVSEQMAKQKLSEREADKFLPWSEVLKTREAVRVAASDLAGVQDYIILCLYTYMPPVRLDYAPMRVVEDETGVEGNYLLVQPKGMTVVLSEYKTAKKYGQLRNKVPRTLDAILREWLVLNPSGWLLCGSRGEPMSETDLGKRVVKIFQEHTKKMVGVNILRHSFVSWTRRGERPLSEQKEMATAMCHSPGMNILYRRI